MLFLIAKNDPLLAQLNVLGGPNGSAQAWETKNIRVGFVHLTFVNATPEMVCTMVLTTSSDIERRGQMSICAKRVEKALGMDGFTPIWIDDNLGSFRFGRLSEHPDLFEQVWLNTQGRKREAVSASVAISVVNSYTATKGLFEERHISELNTHEFRSYSLAENNSTALLWERSLGRIADDAAAQLTAIHGSTLLERTSEVRRLVDQYESKIAEMESMRSLEIDLKRMATPEQLRDASTLAEWPGVCLFRGGQVLYETTCLVLITFAEQIEKVPWLFLNVDPLREPQIMWRIQILADRLLRRFEKAEEYWS